MKCLVLITHPVKDSLCYSLGRHVVARLEEQGHDMEVEYLYESRFEAALSERERLSYYSSGYDSSCIGEQVERLREADAIVLVYPTWWFGFPAILKGWFDRVWGPGIAFDHGNDFGPIKPRLDKLSKMLVVTTLGATWWIDRMVMRQPVKRIVKYAIVGTCARNVELEYLSLYGSENTDTHRFDRFTRKIDRALQAWH